MDNTRPNEHDILLLGTGIVYLQLWKSFAHELQNQVLSIENHLCRLSDALQTEHKPTIEAHIGSIHDSTRCCLDLIRRMTTCSSDRSEATSIDPEEVARTAIHILAFRLKREGIVATIIPGGRTTCRVPQEALEQCLVCILNNSVEAGARRIRIELSSAENTVRIAVTDDGRGINRTALRHVFEPGFTTKTDRSGLGLTLTRILIHRYGGQIAIEPTRSGTAVVISLPA